MNLSSLSVCSSCFPLKVYFCSYKTWGGGGGTGHLSQEAFLSIKLKALLTCGLFTERLKRDEKGCIYLCKGWIVLRWWIAPRCVMSFACRIYPDCTKVCDVLCLQDLPWLHQGVWRPLRAGFTLSVMCLLQVDLAGSENVGRSGAVDKRAREAGERTHCSVPVGRSL